MHCSLSLSRGQISGDKDPTAIRLSFQFLHGDSYGDERSTAFDPDLGFPETDGDRSRQFLFFTRSHERSEVYLVLSHVLSFEDVRYEA